MGNEEDHAMLSDETEPRDARHIHRQQDASQAAKHKSCIHNCHQGIAREDILAHVISAGSHDAQYHKGRYHQPRSSHYLLIREASHYPSPQPAEIEEIAGNEDVTEAHRDIITCLKSHITEGREEERQPTEVLYFVDIAHHHINREEGEKEPDRRVAVEAALHPNVAPLQRLDELVITVRQRIIETEIDDGPNDAAHQIRHKQSFRPVPQIVEVCACGSAFVEVACLEEKEAHKEEAPLHHFKPPILLVLSAEGHDVQRHHSDDADAAKDVKGMVSSFHNI